MATLKLSQINSGTTSPMVPSTDQIVMVRGGATDLLGSTAIPIARVTVTGTSKTLALSDANTIQACSNAATQTITIDTNANVAFPVGTIVAFIQEGAGIITLQGAGGVTLNSTSGNTYSTGTQYTSFNVEKTATDTWIVVSTVLSIPQSNFSMLG